MVVFVKQDQPLGETTKEHHKSLQWFCYIPLENGWYAQWFGYMFFSNDVAWICQHVALEVGVIEKELGMQMISHLHLRTWHGTIHHILPCPQLTRHHCDKFWISWRKQFIGVSCKNGIVYHQCPQYKWLCNHWMAHQDILQYMPCLFYGNLLKRGYVHWSCLEE